MILRFVRARLREAFDLIRYICQILSIVLSWGAPSVYLFGIPDHSNLGDQAQTFCTIQWLKKNYPEYKIKSFDSHALLKNNNFLLRLVKKRITAADLLFFHSGYHTTDLYMVEETMQRKTIQLFPNNKIVVMPQTVNYASEDEKCKSIGIYNTHPNLLFLARDQISYNLAKSYFYNASVYLYPDIVTSMIGKKQYSNSRKGILLCLRNDKESILGKENIDILKKSLETIDTVCITDTTLETDYRFIIMNRRKYLDEIWTYFSKFKVVITDRYHGTIFSLIAGTPVLVMSSSDHKLSSGVDWFPKDFSDYVKYIGDVNNLENEVKIVYSRHYSYSLGDYFDKNYYCKLKTIIG